MASKGRIPPPHLRRPLPGSGIVHPDSFGSGLRLPQGPFPPFEMLPPPEVMEQKIAAQHGEMQRLATENQRLAATHGTLRQELAAAQHELQLLHAHIGAVKAEREQQMRGLVDNIGKMETELKDAEPVRLELQQARVEAENLLVTRQELLSKIHQLSQDLHRAQVDVQQIPALMSELEGLRQEYQRCRVSYDYEKKLFHDHLEQLQTMEKNYITMSRELEKLRSELTKTANVDIRNGGPYGGPAGNESEASGHPAGKNIYEDGYGIPQSQGHPALHNSGAANIGAVGNASAAASRGATGPQGHVAPPANNMPYGSATPPTHSGSGYEAPARGVAGPHGQVAAGNNMPYGSATPPTRSGSVYDASARAPNPARR
ncbi:hypothetical protein D5086_030897 [Populus alba]|uniref:Uncharacterized protein n=1 Tax=Populus alba TaxID=43335 RepID=A0ACC4AQG0_POPAL